MSDLKQYLQLAQGKAENEVDLQNPFYAIGFDATSPRLGWARLIEFSKIKEVLSGLMDTLDSFDKFIFVGMGGSVNGIKPLFSVLQNDFIYSIDSLDPYALAELKDEIVDFSRTLIIPISKSGGTKETQSIAVTLREFCGNEWQKHFLWLTDKGSFSKLEEQWSSCRRQTIQFDGANDIGGRFSCPHTLIFMLPLFLLLNKDFGRLEEIYKRYLLLRTEIEDKALGLAKKYQHEPQAYFVPVVDDSLRQSFASWLYQLFQESLGSKKEGLAAKTILSDCGDSRFKPLMMDIEIDNKVVQVMAYMYFFQCFVAFFAAANGINFVNQDFVEKYKSQMRKLQGQKVEGIDIYDLEALVAAVGKMSAEFKFIDVVLYFHPRPGIIKNIQDAFNRVLPDKLITVVIGSDWNHHSYQATFGDKETFFVFLLLDSYLSDVAPISAKTLADNVESLKVIGKATYLTLKEKSLFAALRGQG